MLAYEHFGGLAGIRRLNGPFWAACDDVLALQLRKKLSSGNDAAMNLHVLLVCWGDEPGTQFNSKGCCSGRVCTL